MRKPVIAALMAFATLPMGTPAHAAEWPARPIRIIAPSTPGGAADTFARLLAEFLPPRLRQKLLVNRRPAPRTEQFGFTSAPTRVRPEAEATGTEFTYASSIFPRGS